MGAPSDSSVPPGVDAGASFGSPYVGAVWVYRRPAGSWSTEAYLKASNPQAYARFGASLAFARGTLLVGAWGERSRATGIDGTPSTDKQAVGAVYLFQRVGGVWAQQAFIKGLMANNGDAFGSSVATDGLSIAVGAPGESTNVSGVFDEPDASAPIVPSSRFGAAFVY